MNEAPSMMPFLFPVSSTSIVQVMFPAWSSEHELAGTENLGAFVYVPKRPKTKPAKTPPAMRTMAMRTISARTGEIALRFGFRDATKKMNKGSVLLLNALLSMTCSQLLGDCFALMANGIIIGCQSYEHTKAVNQ